VHARPGSDRQSGGREEPAVAKKNGISVVTSPDYDAYASGKKGAHEVRCLMCGKAPCSGQHPEFGS
jgi:hypothetical protein